MEFIYLATPFIAWFIAGSLKFVVNSVRAKKLAFGLMGNGGFPSNHASIVSSIATLIALREGIMTPAFGVAVTLAFIVILDAHSLRRQVGKHAECINALTADNPKLHLRERMGHSIIEIIGGLFVGGLVALGMNYIFINI